MTATDTRTIRPTATAAVDLAYAALVDAILDAEMANWRTTEQTFDAALRLLEAARIMPGRFEAVDRTASSWPLLEWCRFSDGWVPVAEVRCAIRGDRAVARALVAQFDLAAVR